MGKRTTIIIFGMIIVILFGMSGISNLGLGISNILLILSPFIIVNAIIANIISKDCQKRNMSVSNWWWAIFFFGIIAIILYLIVRDPRQDIL